MTAHPSTRSAFVGVDIPSGDVIANCIHCGLCLPTCPTYALTGLERSSPRGRIRLIKAVADGDLELTPGFVEEMNFCLDCQACETACPAGVKYGALVEAARAQIFAQRKESHTALLVKKIFLRWFFMRHVRLKALARLLRLYQHAGMQRLLEKSGLLRFGAPTTARLQPLAPIISGEFSSDTLPEIVKPAGNPRYRVAFLTGCLMDVAFADVNVDTVKLLAHHGCEVVIPRGQSCCGSLQAHNGDMQGASTMARRNLELFASLDVDFIVMNSAGCGAYMKEYERVFADDEKLREKARRVSNKVRDITEFLMETGFRPTRPMNKLHVTYHDACHLAHTQKITQQPRELLRAIPNIEFVELPESTWCCGSAGVYNIVQYDTAMKLLDRKINNIKSIYPDVIVTGNPGCLIQIQHGLRQHGLSVRLVHTATFLWEACEKT